MSTSIENLRQLAARDVKDHTAIFDSYVVLGRDIDYLAIKFGLDPETRAIQMLLQSRQLPAGKLPRRREDGNRNRRKSRCFPIRFGSIRKRSGLYCRKILSTILPVAADWEICHGL